MRPIQFILPDEDTFRHALESPRAPWLVTGFILGVGMLYGALVAAFQRVMGGTLSGIPVSEFPGYILYGGNMVSGVLITLAAHAGITLIVWLMARGVGGPGHLGVLYRCTAYLLPLSVPALPYIAAIGLAAPEVAPGPEGAPGPPAALPLQAVYLPLAGLGVAMVLSGLFSLYRTVQGLSPARAGVATALFALFLGSILIIA
jgi:hypothetical protein